MQILVDADACPRDVKELLFRVSARAQVPVTLFANQYMRTPNSPLIRSVQVPDGWDVADNKIVEMVGPGDLVITTDIPLADLVVKKGGFAISPRGQLYTEQNIRQRLSMRDFLAELRSSGVDTGGPPSFGSRDRQAFANQLDKFLARHMPARKDDSAQ